MIVRLTHPQIGVVQRRVSPAHSKLLDIHWEPYGRSSRQFDLPAIAWRQILDQLIDACYGPMGGKLDSQPQSAYSAIGVIQDAVMRMEHHPALRHNALAGWVGDVIPAWRAGPNFSCYPQDSEFVLLVPTHVEHAMKITTWAPGRMPSSETESLTYREGFHLIFGTEPFTLPER